MRTAVKIALGLLSGEAGVSAPVFTDTTLAGAQRGIAYSDGVSANNATSYAVASGSLPDGLTLNEDTGAITGTPTTAGTVFFTIAAIGDGGTTNSGALSITVTQTYAQKVMDIETANMVAYWQQNELTGTTAEDTSINNRDGTYSNVTLDSGDAPHVGMGRAGLWNGTNSYCNVYSASFAAAFNGGEGTISIWTRVSGAGVWTDGTARAWLRFQADANNVVRLMKETVNNRLIFRYGAGGTFEDVIIDSQTDTGWVHWLLVWSKSGDFTRIYKNGVLAGSSNTLGTFSGSLASNSAVFGAQTTGAANPASGYIMHSALWSIAITDSEQIEALATPFPN